VNSRKAAAVAMSIIAIACRICGIFMSAMTVLLCFSGLTAKLQIVGFVVELSRALPGAIAGYGVITSPFGGVFRLDYAIVAVILFVVDGRTGVTEEDESVARMLKRCGRRREGPTC